MEKSIQGEELIREGGDWEDPKLGVFLETLALRATRVRMIPLMKSSYPKTKKSRKGSIFLTQKKYHRAYQIGLQNYHGVACPINKVIKSKGGLQMEGSCSRSYPAILCKREGLIQMNRGGRGSRESTAMFSKHGVKMGRRRGYLWVQGEAGGTNDVGKEKTNSDNILEIFNK